MSDDVMIRKLYQYVADVYGIKLTDERIAKLVEYGITPYDFERRAAFYAMMRDSGREMSRSTTFWFYLPPRRAQRFRRLRAWMRRVLLASS